MGASGRRGAAAKNGRSGRTPHPNHRRRGLWPGAPGGARPEKPPARGPAKSDPAEAFVPRARPAARGCRGDRTDRMPSRGRRRRSRQAPQRMARPLAPLWRDRARAGATDGGVRARQLRSGPKPEPLGASTGRRGLDRRPTPPSSRSHQRAGGRSHASTAARTTRSFWSVPGRPWGNRLTRMAPRRYRHTPVCNFACAYCTIAVSVILTQCSISGFRADVDRGCWWPTGAQERPER